MKIIHFVRRSRQTISNFKAFGKGIVILNKYETSLQKLHHRVGNTTISRNLSTNSKIDSFLSGSSSVYIDQMYDAWKTDPSRSQNLENLYSIVKTNSY